MNCPYDNSPLIFERGCPPIIGGPPDNWAPDTPDELFCDKCGWLADEETLTKWMEDNLPEAELD